MLQAIAITFGMICCTKNVVLASCSFSCSAQPSLMKYKCRGSDESGSRKRGNRLMGGEHNIKETTSGLLILVI